MAGIIRLIDIIPSISGSQTENMTEATSTVCWGLASYWLDVESIARSTGSVDLAIRWRTITNRIISVAGVVNVTTTGLFEIIPIGSAFTATIDPKPEPLETVITFVGDTTEFSGRIYMIAA